MMPINREGTTMIYRFHHIHLLCSDLETTIDFFIGMLGAKLAARQKFGGADGASLDLNGTTVNLRVAGENETVHADAPLPVYGYHHMCVEVDNVDAAYQELTDKKVEFIVTPRNTPDNLRVAFFKGPDDIVIEVLQRL
jgi:catechol 2,3-dioxygenase-like lactoylglutathione lyase family enzyme